MLSNAVYSTTQQTEKNTEQSSRRYRSFSKRGRSKLFRPNFLGAGRKHTLAGVARDATLPSLRYTGNNAGEAWEITSGQELMVQRKPNHNQG